MHTTRSLCHQPLFLFLRSFFVILRIVDIAHVHRFVDANYEYRVFTQPFGIFIASHICKTHMGDRARLLMLTSTKQKHVVQVHYIFYIITTDLNDFNKHKYYYFGSFNRKSTWVVFCLKECTGFNEDQWYVLDVQQTWF